MQAISLAPPSRPLQLALTFAVSRTNTRPARTGYPSGVRTSVMRPTPPVFRIPDVGERQLKRIVIYFRDIWQLSLNERRGCWAHSHYFQRRYGRGSAPTFRRWRALLDACGWTASEFDGPNRLIRPLALPEQIAAVLPRFARHFKRLLSMDLSAFSGSAPYLSLDREINNMPEPARRREPAPPLLPPLSAQERAVVAAAKAAGVSADAAEPLVREAGAPSVREALEALAFNRERYRASGKTIQSPGGYVREYALHLAKGLWSLPGALLEAKERAERRAERDRAAEKRVVRAEPAGTPPPLPPAPPSDLARLLLLPEAEVTKLEEDARDAMTAKGGAAAWMVGRLHSSWREGAGEILRKEMVRLLDQKEKKRP
jgi:hypothetical protein